MGKKKGKKNRKPIGLKISRNGESFTFTWNNGDKYSGLGLQYAIKYDGQKTYSAWQPGNKKWISFSNHKTTKWSKKFSGQSDSKYTAIKFRVRGMYKKTWYVSKAATYDIKPPKKPSFSLAFNSDFSDPAVTLTWSVENNKASNNWFYAVGWKTRLKNNITKLYEGGGDGWSSINYDTSASKSVTIREDPNKVFVQDSSYTREVQLVAIGPGGYTPAKYKDSEIA